MTTTLCYSHTSLLHTTVWLTIIVKKGQLYEYESSKGIGSISITQDVKQVFSCGTAVIWSVY